MLRFAVIGYGYWGPNIVRNLRGLEGCQVVGICDQTPAARKRIQAAHPGVPVHSDANELINSPDVDAVAVITPVWTHYELTKAALENGKHVFVEKPFTSNVAQAEELINLADAEEPADHGGSHVPVYRRGPQNKETASRWDARQALLLRFNPREPGTFSARCAT